MLQITQIFWRRVTTFAILILCAIPSLNAQIADTLWQRFYGGTKMDEIRSVTENLRGEIVCAGITKSKKHRKEDVLIRILDQEGRVRIMDNFGGKKNDGANKIIATYDGGYIIAGYTNSNWDQSRGKQDAWLVKTDEFGQPLWHKILGGKEQDMLLDVVQLRNGNLVTVGYQGNKPLVTCISPDGQEICWELLLKETDASANAITLNERQQIAISGTTNLTKKPKVFFTILNEDGSIVLPLKTIKDNSLVSGDAMVHDPSNNTYLIAGNYYDKKTREDLGIACVDNRGRKKWLNNYGGFRVEKIGNLTLIADDKILLTGRTNSHLRGARRYNGCYHVLEKDGQETTSTLNDYGGFQNDYLKDVYALADGHVLLAGASASYQKGWTDRDAWLIKLENTSTSSTPDPKINIGNIQWNETFKNDSLDANERGYISFDIDNIRDSKINGLKLLVKTLDTVENLYFFDTIYLPTIRENSSKMTSVPVIGGRRLASAKATFDITIVDAFYTPLQNFQQAIQTKSQRLPKLEIINSRFIKESEFRLPERREPIQLELTIRNTGTAIAEDVGTRFFYPTKIEALSEADYKIGTLNPGDSAKVLFEFQAKAYYELDTIIIRAATFEKSLIDITRASFDVPIKNFYDIEDNPEFIKSPENNHFRGKGGPSLIIDNVKFNVTDISWLSPHEDDGLEQSVPDASLALKLRIKTNEELSIKNFSLLLNGTSLNGINSESEAEALAKNVKLQSKATAYIYIHKVILKPGRNELILHVRSRDKEYVSNRMIIHYKPPKTNLHIYSIGVPHNDLKYTSRDATDFANAYSNQKGGLFKEVYIHSFANENNTRKDTLAKSIESIKGNFFRKKIIKEDDIIMVFLSSHGFIYRSRRSGKHFRVATSDYRRDNTLIRKATSLNFAEDILETLDNLEECKKILFLDACYSGFAANESEEGDKSNDDPNDLALSQALIDLAESDNSYTTIVSCSAGQKSYEDSAWENGAFTQALIEAFDNKKVEYADKKYFLADKDDNGIIYVDELNEFLIRRVPYLVRKDRGKIQEPYIPNEQLKDNKPLFLVSDK